MATDAAERIERAVPSVTSIGYNGPVDAESLQEPSKIQIDVRIEINPKDDPPDRRDLFWIKILKRITRLIQPTQKAARLICSVSVL